jgi:hypothetical protein
MAESVAIGGVVAEDEATNKRPHEASENTDKSSGAESLTGMMNHGDVRQLILLQSQALAELQGSTDVLSSFNEMSEDAYRRVKRNYTQHTKIVTRIKSDLHVVLMRIRTIKQILNDKHNAGLDLHTRESSDSEEEAEGTEEHESIDLP